MQVTDIVTGRMFDKNHSVKSQGVTADEKPPRVTPTGLATRVVKGISIPIGSPPQHTPRRPYPKKEC